MKLQYANKANLTLLLAGLLVLLTATTAFAQDGIQKQDRDRDQVDAPGSGDMLRDRDELNLRTGVASGTGTGTQQQNQLQNQYQLNDGNPTGEPQVQQRVQNPESGLGKNQSVNASGTQDRDQLRIHASSSTELRTMTQTQLQTATGTLARNRATVEAARAAEGLLGQRGPAISEIAQQMDQRLNNMEQAETRLNERGWFNRFFFGQDQDAAAELRQEAEQFRLQAQEMNQLLNECDENCDADAKLFLQEQIRATEAEHNRIMSTANEAAGNRGVFGFLFGWLY